MGKGKVQIEFCPNPQSSAHEQKLQGHDDRLRARRAWERMET
jgi:hypothetical protein